LKKSIEPGILNIEDTQTRSRTIISSSGKDYKSEEEYAKNFYLQVEFGEWHAWSDCKQKGGSTFQAKVPKIEVWKAYCAKYNNKPPLSESTFYKCCPIEWRKPEFEKCCCTACKKGHTYLHKMKSLITFLKNNNLDLVDTSPTSNIEIEFYKLEEHLYRNFLAQVRKNTHPPTAKWKANRVC